MTGRGQRRERTMEDNRMTIRKSIRIDRPVETAFRVFCEEIGQWWPKRPSFGDKVTRDTFLEARVGGRFYQQFTDGSEFEIGRVTTYEPPSIVAFTWRAPSWDVGTLVEVRFTADGSGTRVELEHSGWEQTEKVREFRKNYDGGWEVMLGHYQARAGNA
jgi:uncharacterized protein YndB with AHSA1/START domain